MRTNDVARYGLCGKFSVPDILVKRTRAWVEFMLYRQETGQGQYPSVLPFQDIHPIRHTTSKAVAGRFYKCEK